MDITALPILDDDLATTAIVVAYVPAVGAEPAALYRVNLVALVAGKVSVKDIADTDYTLELGDNLKYLRATSATGCNITVPPQADVPFDVGALISVRAAGDGLVQFIAGDGVTLNPPGGAAFPLTFAEDGATVQALLVDAAGDEWDIIGGTTLP